MAARLDLDRLAADVVATLEARGAKRHGDELRFRCLSADHEDANASADYNLTKHAYMCQSCGASGGLIRGDYPIASLLGLDPADYRSNGGAPTQSWNVCDVDGKVVAVHHRRDLPNGEKKVWWTRNGSPGLDGLKTADLPLYGSHLLKEREPGDDAPVFLAEGEKATDALLAAGFQAVGTVVGAAAQPSAKVLAVLAGRDVTCWSDNDPQGRRHMRKVACRLITMAPDTRIFEPEGLPAHGDAVEWIAAHNTGNDADVARELLTAVAERAVEPDSLIADDVDAAATTDDLADAADVGGHDLTHDALALELGNHWGEARYVAAWGRWYFWVGTHWAEDVTLLHMTRCRDFLRSKADAFERAAADCTDPNSAEKIQRRAVTDAARLKSAPNVAAVVGLARSNVEQAAAVGQWDCDPWLLGTAGGTVNLNSGELRPAAPADYITKITSVALAPPGTPTPLWCAFLDRIMNSDAELIAYLCRFAGYCLTGSTKEHVFVFGHGKGGNGKGVFVGTLQSVFGEYAQAVPTEMLMVSHNERHPTDVARLRGARLAVGSETEVGKRWAEAKIKQLTGGDRLAARFMRQDYFEFDPTFKLFVVGNHKPSLYGVDDAIRRRLHLVPFNVKIPADEVDVDLPEKLRAEWPGILRWAVDGCLEWQERGLDPPESVLAATDAYLAGEDAVGRWLEDRTTDDPNCFESSANLFADWRGWAEKGGEFVGSRRKLSQELLDRGFKQHRERSPVYNNARGFLGIHLQGEE